MSSKTPLAQHIVRMFRNGYEDSYEILLALHEAGSIALDDKVIIEKGDRKKSSTLGQALIDQARPPRYCVSFFSDTAAKVLLSMDPLFFCGKEGQAPWLADMVLEWSRVNDRDRLGFGGYSSSRVDAWLSTVIDTLPDDQLSDALFLGAIRLELATSCRKILDRVPQRWFGVDEKGAPVLRHAQQNKFFDLNVWEDGLARGLDPHMEVATSTGKSVPFWRTVLPKGKTNSLAQEGSTRHTVERWIDQAVKDGTATHEMVKTRNEQFLSAVDHVLRLPSNSSNAMDTDGWIKASNNFPPGWLSLSHGKLPTWVNIGLGRETSLVKWANFVSQWFQQMDHAGKATLLTLENLEDKIKIKGNKEVANEQMEHKRDPRSEEYLAKVVAKKLGLGIEPVQAMIDNAFMQLSTPKASSQKRLSRL